jgi:hypothetical protein
MRGRMDEKSVASLAMRRLRRVARGFIIGAMSCANWDPKPGSRVTFGARPSLLLPKASPRRVRGENDAITWQL